MSSITYLLIVSSCWAFLAHARAVPGTAGAEAEFSLLGVDSKGVFHAQPTATPKVQSQPQPQPQAQPQAQPPPPPRPSPTSQLVRRDTSGGAASFDVPAKGSLSATAAVPAKAEADTNAAAGAGTAVPVKASTSVSSEAMPGASNVALTGTATAAKSEPPIGDTVGPAALEVGTAGAQAPITAATNAAKAVSEGNGKKARLGALFPVLLGLMIISIVLMFMFLGMSKGGKGEGEEAKELIQKVKPEPVDEDLYGMSIASLARDTQRFVQGSEALWLRFSRLAISMLTLFFCMLLQYFLISKTKSLISSEYVENSRSMYDKYEIWMYHGDEDASHLMTTENNYHRGVEEYFDVARFQTLPNEVKDSACHIPFSQPTFFMTILVIWTFTCVVDIRKAIDLGFRMIRSTPTIDSMADACKPDEDDESNLVVVGLTGRVKSVICVFVIIPRLILAFVLLWLGCRWLTATTTFADLVLNCVALEFILCIKDVLYNAMASDSNKRLTRSTLLLPVSKEEAPTFQGFLGAFLWGVISILFVLLYMYVLQGVLPHYQWDVADACAEYLASVGGHKK